MSQTTVDSCDLALSSDDAIFATPGVNIGLFCSTPMVAVSRKVSRKRTMKMLLKSDLLLHIIAHFAFQIYQSSVKETLCAKAATHGII